MISAPDSLRGLNQELTDQPLLLCIGDSYTYGDGVAADQAWPHLLGQKLPEYQVINAGVRGANLSMMQEALHHYQSRKSATHILLTILDIDILRLSGHLKDEEFFIDSDNYYTELESNCTLLEDMLRQCNALHSSVSVNLWGRDIFITRFQHLSSRLSQTCADNGAFFSNKIASLMSVMSYQKFSVSPENGHPGERAHRLIAKHMFDTLLIDQWESRHAN